VLYYIGTVGKTEAYTIPSSFGVTPKMSSILEMSSILFGNPARLLLHKHEEYNHYNTEDVNATKEEENSWVSIDLGEGRSLMVNYYCLRHGYSNHYYRLQSWDFEGSNDGSEWTVLRVHKDDNSLPHEGFSVAAWEVEGVSQAYRHFRIRMTGKASGDHHALSCAGIELWGRLLSR
jgi:hypothetical protein